MTPLRILHIVPWFPNSENEIEAIFIAKHIAALKKHHQNRVLHIRFGDKKKHEYDLNYTGISLDRIQLNPLINKWRVKELMAKYYINNYLKKHEGDFDIINFYIAYPNAIGIGSFQKEYPHLTFTITDQWSAYHEEFNLPKGHKGRERIERIFHASPPLFVVSNALGQDIRNFADLPALKYQVIPNIVDDHFNYHPKVNEDMFTFCSINNWSTLKNPFVLIKAFNIVQKSHPNTRLILGGTGVLSEGMRELVDSLKLSDKVNIRGRLSKEGVSSLLQDSQAYCQSSNYETFSAICIESLATGTPVIATNIGGMKDFVKDTNGFLVDVMTPLAWSEAMLKMIQTYSQFNNESISKETIDLFNSSKIGLKYATYFQQAHVLNEK